MPQLKIFLFGSPRVRLDGADLHFSRRKSLALLCYLAMQPHPVGRENLGVLLWGARGRANLRRALQLLRAMLGEQFVHSTRHEVGLHTDKAWVDVHQFERLAQPRSRLLPAQLRSPDLSLTAWQEAADLYQGGFLQGLKVETNAFQRWQSGQEHQWAAHAATLLHNLSLALFERQDWETAEHYALHWVALDETEEQAHRLLMQIYIRQGNPAKASQQYEACKETLAKYDLEPTMKTRRLYERINRSRRRFVATPPVQEPVRPPTNGKHILTHWAPPPLPKFHTPFFGRQDEVEEVINYLKTPACRLLTLLAPGGMGKTRLAVAVGERSRDDFRDGILFVDLSSVPGSTNLFNILYLYLSESYREQVQDPREALMQFIARRSLLLILDNFEHFTHQAARITYILQHCPNVKCLATSRERLNLSEEWVYTLDGLTYPHDLISSEISPLLSQYSAVQLFVQRARQNAPHFAVTRENQDAIVRICRSVEGMPLAIEMAAAWAQQLPCDAIAEKLEQQLDFLESAYRNIPGRHRSIRASCLHSWNLLTAEEQNGLCRFSVFHNGCDYKAASAVTGLGLAEIAGLVNKSWLRSNARGRYFVHALIHQFLQEQLQQHTLLEQQTLQAHARYYAEDLQRIAREFTGSTQKAALDYVAEDLGNIEAAWDWAVVHGGMDLLDAMSLPLFDFYRLRNLFLVGKERFHQTLKALEKHHKARQHPVYNHLRNRFAWFVYITDDYTQARALWREGARYSEETGDILEAAFCHHHLGVVAQHQGQLDAAHENLVKSLEQYQQEGTAYHIALCRKQLGYVHYLKGNYEQAEAMYRQSLETFESLEDLYNMGLVYAYMSDCTRMQGRLSEAEAYAETAVKIATKAGNQRLRAMTLNRLANILPPEEAVRVQTTIVMIFESQDDWSRAAISYNNLAAEYLKLKNYTEAREAYQSAASIFEEHRDKRGVFFTTVNIARMYIQMKNANTAHKQLRTALLQALHIGSPPLVLYALCAVAELFAALEEWPHALALVAFLLQHPETQDDTREQAEAILLDATQVLSEVEIGRLLVPFPLAHYHQLLEEYLSQQTFTLPELSDA